MTVDEWDPNSEQQRGLLTKLAILDAPHETRAVMRMHRSGHDGQTIMKTLRITGQSMVKQMQLAMDEEGAAHRRKVGIHDAKMPRGAK